MATDYISREAAIACFHDWIDRYGHEHTADEIVEYQRIEDLPVADVVEVVRCQDCVHLYKGEFGDLCCSNHCGLAMVTEDAFCPYGRKKDDG